MNEQTPNQIGAPTPAMFSEWILGSRRTSSQKNVDLIVSLFAECAHYTIEVSKDGEDMAKFEDLRAFALELPLAYEDLHFNGPAFRVRSRKFALFWTPTEQTIMKLPQHQQQANFEERPAVFQPIRVGTVFWSQVALSRLTKRELKALTISAWRTVAPKRLVKEFLAGEYETPPNPWLTQY